MFSSRHRCPHQDIRHCPLYVASHVSALGCDDGRLDEHGCGADRAIDFATAMAKLRAAMPRTVAECEFLAHAEQARAQRWRNMKLAGIH